MDDVSALVLGVWHVPGLRIQVNDAYLDPVGIAVGLCCSQLLLGNLYLLVIVESCNSCQLPLRRGYRLAVAKCLKRVQTRFVGEISSWQAIGPHCA